jgi:hypothetical protein
MVFKWFMKFVPVGLIIKLAKSTNPEPCKIVFDSNTPVTCNAVEIFDGVYVVRVAEYEWRRKYQYLMRLANNIKDQYLGEEAD